MERTRMTKSFSCVGLIACFVLVCIFVSSPQQACGASDSKVYNWRMQTSDPPALMGPTTTVKGFIERVKQMSHGRLDITLFTAGQLVPTMEIFDALGKKTIDIAYTSGVYYTGTVPEGSLELTSLPPLLLPTLKDALQVYWYLGVDQLMRDAYAEKGVYYLGSVFLGDPITNWSKNPMHKASDFVGHKVRSFGYISKTLQKLGATPTLIPHEEVYTALAQGVIDGSLTAGSYYQRLKYYEVCP
jgi:TRAP-type mannitol/chloroaromatic compound transport system substrate-binding protein